MSFTILGRICESESKLGVPGLIVRAYDKERRYDNLQKTTKTDKEGRFKMIYQETQVADLLKAPPEIFFRILAPPFRFLLDATQTFPWGRRPEEHIEIEIPRQQLGPISPARPDGIVEAAVNLTKADLKIDKAGIFDVPHLANWDNIGPVGAPSLPGKTHYIVLPLGAKVLKLEVQPGQPIRLPATVNPFAVQLPESNAFLEFNDQFFSKKDSPAPVHSNYLNGTNAYPEKMVFQGSMVEKESVQILSVVVHPVQFDPVKRNFVFYPNLRYTVHYELHGDEPTKALSSTLSAGRIFKQNRLERLQRFLDRDQVFLAKDLGIPNFAIEKTRGECLIITDEHKWPGTLSHAPTKDDALPLANGAGIVAQFERLAKWKTSRGMRTRVVRVMDIVRGTYGDFTEKGFARDVQEVIRNFVKWAYDEWNIDYLLIGGSDRIVPMRRLLSYIVLEGKYPAWDFSDYGNIDPEIYNVSTTNPPPRGRALVENAARLCHDGTYWTPNSESLLCNSHGKKIPFKKDINAIYHHGWYFATKNYLPLYDSDGNLSGTPEIYLTENAYPETPMGSKACNLIVGGPKSIIDDDFYWAIEPYRFIPSDLYYARMHPGPLAGHKHDFDIEDNGCYGQHRWDDDVGEYGKDVTLESHDTYNPDIWVGRAPVDSAIDARSFIYKVLTYERLMTPESEGKAVDSSYLRKVIMGADLWDEKDNKEFQDPSASITPQIGKFVILPDASGILVHLQSGLVDYLKTNPTKGPYVVVRLNDKERAFGKDIQVTRGGNAIGPSWDFVERKGHMYVHSDEPTEYVKITGNFPSSPQRIVWFDVLTLVEGKYTLVGRKATPESEEILSVINREFKDFNRVQRYYGDYIGVSPPAMQLNVDNIRKALNSGSHFVSLKGHGCPDGCCMVWWTGGPGSRPDFDNKDNYFIATADSCSTALPDFVTRSLGEDIVLHPEGGAVAYVGCTRMGVGGGHYQIKQFWMELKKHGRLGPAAGNQDFELSCMYSIYVQILYGDPEMPVWTEVPETYQVVHPDYLDISKDSHNLEVTVSCNDRSLSRQNVTIMEGWTTSQHDPRILQSKTTDDQGKATFSLDKLPEDMKEITLTVVPSIIGSNWPNYVPYSIKIPVVRLQRGWKRCTKCHGLFLGSKSGICPKDNSPHTEASGEDYRLIYEPSSDQAQKIPSHQPNWRWCKKCKSLFYFPKNKEQGDQNKENYDYGICSGQGEKHSREGSSIYQVKILPGTQTQTQWRWCDKCQVLHYVTGSTTGSCYGGENHHAAGSMYSVLRDVFVYTPD
jgi:hypothetical protein